MKLYVGLILVILTNTASVAASYGLYSREGKISMTESNGLYRVTHIGKQDWAMAATRMSYNVKPGDLLKISCTAREISAKSDVTMSAVLLDKDGKVLSWSYSRTPLSVGATVEKTFAIPVNGAKIYPRITGYGDADVEVGPLELKRSGAIPRPERLPPTLALSTSALFVEVKSDSLALAVTDRRTGRKWMTRKRDDAYMRCILRTFEADKLQIRLGVTDAITLDQLDIAFRLEPESPSEFTVTVSGDGPCVAPFAYPDPIRCQRNDMMVLPLSEGYRLPMYEKTFPISEPPMWSSSMSMAFFGIEEDATGAGWMAIAETRNDAKLKITNDADGRPVALGPVWMPERGQYGYPRVIRYCFLDRGGYVAMAKRYRQTAEAQGLVKTFREKVKTRPNVDRLLGAPNIWYFPSRQDPSPAIVAHELQEAGIGRFLWSNGRSADDVRAIAALPNVLVGRYDCYRDIYTPQLLKEMGQKRTADDICLNTSAWPGSAIWNSADPNDLRQAWGVTCKDGKKRYCAAQCTLCQPAHTREHVAAELKTKPFTSRFIDVTTAVGAEECENPEHPMTRTQSRQAGCEALGLLGDEFGLVVGSEQGIDFAVPFCDYFEGMMSPGRCRMPHGRKGAQRHDIFREGLYPTNVTPQEMSLVVNYHLGEKFRVPLFELVYHDCCCAHWYWYDYSNRPICLWPKRDLFSVLYGTAPMYVFDYRHWQEHRSQFVKSFRAVCPVARKTGYSLMTDHRALTSDRSVQRSTFADGTVVTVNFGQRPYRLEDGTELAPMDFSVTAPSSQIIF